ncbi:hypothetical protein [Pseudomonas petrae]|uniref:Uncharacterized protein n=1 Tax=Pseudomonas petrae TaxID=2912190 RepID=A0ABS9IE12_9PSED|nr:hypothetical protein [Pseudomonas petrae]MCF7531995.1 hypothetical protein [Pseudomonas petrae]MCF7537558.1 hypothetical protein [Pseudomonas petrae]MCF7545536.1 hypothetical protein [Pseudomonas petrae]MCF7556685.1 hypothetical protein [Pseudomonas petrae]
MRSVNPLTGQLYVAMAFDPKTSELVDYDASVWPIQIPSLAGSFDKLQEQLKAFVDKLRGVPLGELATNLNGSFAELKRPLKQVNSALNLDVRGALQQTQKTLSTFNEDQSKNSPARVRLGQAMNEVQRTARSVHNRQLVGRGAAAMGRSLPVTATTLVVKFDANGWSS